MLAQTKFEMWNLKDTFKEESVCIPCLNKPIRLIAPKYWFILDIHTSKPREINLGKVQDNSISCLVGKNGQLC